jgi:hypothetical protein
VVVIGPEAPPDEPGPDLEPDEEDAGDEDDDCDPPYRFDDHGIKHYRRECLDE